MLACLLCLQHHSSSSFLSFLHIVSCVAVDEQQQVNLTSTFLRLYLSLNASDFFFSFATLSRFISAWMWSLKSKWNLIMCDGNWRYILTHFNLAGCLLEIELLNFHTSNQLEAIETIVISPVLINDRYVVEVEGRVNEAESYAEKLSASRDVAKSWISNVRIRHTSTVRLKHIDAEWNIKKSCLMDF